MGSPDPVTVGLVIDDRHRIDAEAGSGGMAVVYRATHLKLSTTVALKVMSPNPAGDPEFQRRFEDEARSASEIDHDHVIPVYDLARTTRSLHRDALRRAESQGPAPRPGALEPVSAVQVTEQVASALDAAHARCLLHADVKAGQHPD